MYYKDHLLWNRLCFRFCVRGFLLKEETSGFEFWNLIQSTWLKIMGIDDIK